MTGSRPPGTSRLSMTERAIGAASVLVVAGNVDMAAAPLFAARIGEMLRSKPTVMIVDMIEVNFLTTAGMSILAEAQRRSTELFISFRVVADGPTTLRPMQLLGIDGVIEIHPSVSAALAGGTNPRLRE